MIRARLPRRKFTGLRNILDFSGLREKGYLLLLIGAFILTLGCKFFYRVIAAILYDLLVPSPKCSIPFFSRRLSRKPEDTPSTFPSTLFPFSMLVLSLAAFYRASSQIDSEREPQSTLLACYVLLTLDDFHISVNIMALFCTLAGITFFCWLSVSSPAGFVVWVFFYGLAAGTYITVSSTLTDCICQLAS